VLVSNHQDFASRTDVRSHAAPWNGLKSDSQRLQSRAIEHGRADFSPTSFLLHPRSSFVHSTDRRSECNRLGMQGGGKMNHIPDHEPGDRRATSTSSSLHSRRRSSLWSRRLSPGM
jgi:hypothetical protein